MTESNRPIIFLNATARDASAMSQVIDGLGRRGIPIVDAAERPAIIMTVWSRESILDEAVVAMAARAQGESRQLPVQIDNVEPPIGFRQVQNILLLDLSEVAAEQISSMLGLGKSEPAVVVRRSTFSWLDNILFTTMFAVVAYPVFKLYANALGIKALFAPGFLFMTIAAAALLGTIAYLSPIIARPAARQPFVRLMLIDLAIQAGVVGLSGVALSTGEAMAPGMAGGAWGLPSALAVSSLAGILARWGLVVLLAKLRNRRP